MDRRCDKCEYKAHNYCRRYPPTVFMNDGLIRNRYPEIHHENNWCGEFKAKEE